MSGGPSVPSPTDQHERGAILVEAGLVLPLLFFLIMGIIEVGGVVGATTSTTNSVRAGGRMATVQRNSAMADQAILARMAQEAGALRDGEVEYVVIWHATGPDDEIPSNCIPSNTTAPSTSSRGVQGSATGGSCNIYVRPQATGGAFRMATGDAGEEPGYYFGCTGTDDPLAGRKVDCYWPPMTRRTVIAPRCTPSNPTYCSNPPQFPDYVGVYMSVEHRYFTGLMGSTRTITHGTINMLEPSNFGVGT